MTINISDVVVTIGQQVNNSEWLEFFKILLPVFVGSYITYIATEKAKKDDIKRENIKKFAFVGQIATFCFNDICVYKEQVLNPIREKIDSDHLEEGCFLTALYIPNNEFNINIQEHIFLADNNFLFLDLLNKTNTIFQLYKQSIENYNEYVNNHINSKVILKEEYHFNKEKFIRTFETVENLTNEVLIRLYYVLKNCNSCYSRFYNLSCLDNIEDNFKNMNLENSLSLKDILYADKYKHIREYQENFEKNWKGHPNLSCTLCYLLRRFKYNLKCFKNFILFPNNCTILKKKKSGKNK